MIGMERQNRPKKNGSGPHSTAEVRKLTVSGHLNGSGRLDTCVYLADLFSAHR
jgi:hypothetical protein